MGSHFCHAAPHPGAAAFTAQGCRQALSLLLRAKRRPRVGSSQERALKRRFACRFCHFTRSGSREPALGTRADSGPGRARLRG